MKTYLKECRWGDFLLLRGDMICAFVDMYGEWSETEVDLFRALLPPNGVCVEVGSNIGMHTIPLSTICHEGWVFGYEPQRPIFHILCANIALNNRLNVVARNAAVGDRDGQVRVHTGDYDAAWNYGAFSIESGFNRESAFRGRVSDDWVDILRLDSDRRLREAPRLDLLKIDAEGYDAKVVEGARELIARHSPDIFIEANALDSFTEIMGKMTALNYEGYWFVSSRHRLDNFGRSPFRVEGHDINIIFRPRNRPLPRPLKPVTSWNDLSGSVPILNSY